MKQILSHDGKIIIEELPTPSIKKGEILVKTAYSLISAGTELSGKKSSGKLVIKKILSDKELLKQGIKFLKEKGIQKTLGMASELLSKKIALGYSLSGEIMEVGNDVKEFKKGDRVACAGANKASHAEFVAVPENLAVKIPESLDFQSASSVTLGAIAMQGLRRAEVNLNENIAIIGLGLLGQILVQLLKVNGAKVIGFDIDNGKVELARITGIDFAYNSSTIDILEKIANFTKGKGVDATIITASAPKNNDIVQQAMEITRRKGKVVVVGNVGLSPKRSPFYEKEIDYLISTSYGPGRYDESYEEKGIDYPFAYVRWTEKRNMEAYLNLLAEAKIDFQKLISKIFSIEQAAEAYSFLEKEHPAKPAVLLDYHFEKPKEIQRKIEINSIPLKKEVINVGIIGAGGFARAIHLPNLKSLSNVYSIKAICDLDGINAKKIAQKFETTYCTTNYKEILQDKSIDMVLLALPHNLHVKISIEAAQNGKAIFCEKPMALHQEELQELVTVLRETNVPYLVGFNRRFSPFLRKIKEIIKNRENPMLINYQMNAGYLPKDHWTQIETGGGRNIGEACHIYDLFTFLTESEIEKTNAYSINPKTEKYLKNDNFITNLKFKDGSICNLTYTAAGSRDYPKEEMKIYYDGKLIFLNDYKELKIYKTKIKGLKARRQEKGHFQELEKFARSIKQGNGYPIPLWQMLQATEISFKVEEQL